MCKKKLEPAISRCFGNRVVMEVQAGHHWITQQIILFSHRSENSIFYRFDAAKTLSSVIVSIRLISLPSTARTQSLRIPEIQGCEMIFETTSL